MCGRYTVLTEDEIIKIREILRSISLGLVKDEVSPDSSGQREVFPSNTAPIITQERGGMAFTAVKWGFKKWDGQGVIINARAETLRDKAMFAKCLYTGRCVVPAGEFFEWERLGSSKRKYYAKDKDGNLLFMAGLYRNMIDPAARGSFAREFVIITKEARGEIAAIHDRMPVILRTDQIEAWLTGRLSPDELPDLEYEVTIKPCDNDREG